MDAQIQRQDIEAFSAWKKQLDLTMKETKGEGASKYLAGLTNKGQKVQARMGITENDPTVESLRRISKVIIALLF